MKKLLLVAAAVLLSSSQCHADIVLSSFEFAGGSLAVTSEAFAGSSGDITFGTDPALGASWSVDGANEQLIQNSAIAGPNIAEIQNRFGFTYTVTGLGVGETLDITGATLDFAGTSNTVRFNYLLDGGLTENPNFNPPASGNYVALFNSTAGTFQTDRVGLVNGDTVDFNFTARDNGGPGFTADNFVLRGEVITAVPEPTAFSLFGFGTIALFAQRRKRN